MNNKLQNDLTYWAEKWNHAEKKMYGPQADEMIKVCKAMSDKYLDDYLESKKLGLIEIENELQEVLVS